MKTRDIIIGIGQILLGIIISVIGIIFINFQIPGQRNFCDSDQIFMYYALVILIVLSVGLVLNSLIFLRKNKWPQYRKFTFGLTSIIIFLIVSVRFITTKVQFGSVSYLIENESESSTIVRMRLFKNNKFISETYDLSCNIENIGTYVLAENELVLTFKNKKSEYLGTKYSLKNDTLRCVDCSNERILIMNKN